MIHSVMVLKTMLCPFKLLLVLSLLNHGDRITPARGTLLRRVSGQSIKTITNSTSALSLIQAHIARLISARKSWASSRNKDMGRDDGMKRLSRWEFWGGENEGVRGKG